MKLLELKEQEIFYEYVSVKSLLDLRISCTEERKWCVEKFAISEEIYNADQGGGAGAVKRLPCTWLGRNKFRPKYAKSFNGPAVFTRGTGGDSIALLYSMEFITRGHVNGAPGLSFSPRIRASSQMQMPARGLNGSL